MSTDRVIKASEFTPLPVRVTDVTTCQRCWAMVPKQYGEAHMYWHEKLDEQIGGDPDA